MFTVHDVVVGWLITLHTQVCENGIYMYYICDFVQVSCAL